MTEGLAARAGVPMPALYVIETEQPNAFATGRNPENAAVAVTTGLLRRLNRDELQGVIAHEIGHTLGLEHCENTRCVMNFSPTVREVDVKEEALCGSCQRALD